MAKGDITEVKQIGVYALRKDPFYPKDMGPYNGKALDLEKFNCVSHNINTTNKVLGLWEPTRPKSEFRFPYKNIYELLLHSGVQVGNIGEDGVFATKEDLIEAGYTERTAETFGYKYTIQGSGIGYNEVYLEKGLTLENLPGKEVNCLMVSRFSTSGIVNGQRKTQRVKPNKLRYRFFITTGDINLQDANFTPTSKPSIGPRINFDNYKVASLVNNENYKKTVTGTNKKDIYDGVFISNIGNKLFRYSVECIDPNLVLVNPKGVCAAFKNKPIWFRIKTTNLIAGSYVAMLKITTDSDELRNIDIPVVYKIS